MKTLEPDAWDRLERHLINLGHLSPEGVGRRAQPRRCRTCGARILVGLDADLCSTRAEADPVPLSPLGEMLAHLEGRRTWALVSNAGRYVLDYRDAGRITHRPAGTPRLDVLAEHRCASATRLPAVPSSFATTNATNLPGGSPCPY